MTTIAKAIHTCYGIPSTWDVWTDAGQYMHFKYRHGTAKVFVGPEDGPLELESAVSYGDRLNGITTLEEFCQATGFELGLHEPYVPLPDPNGPENEALEDLHRAYEDAFGKPFEPPAGPPIRAQILREAESLICGDREEQYGSPSENLQRIADYWNRYLEDVDGDIGPRDVALMMVLMKVARESGGYKRDSLVDIAGYAGIAAEAAEAA